MNDQKRVVFPTDFSEASLQAFPHAVELSRRVDACLTVLYVHLPFTDDPYNEAVCADIASHVKGFVDGRFAELQGDGAEASVAQVQADIEKRDKSDESRDVGPLKPAEDAVIVDTTDMGIEEVVDKLLNLIEKNG